jgi:hypothetical protein
LCGALLKLETEPALAAGAARLWSGCLARPATTLNAEELTVEERILAAEFFEKAAGMRLAPVLTLKSGEILDAALLGRRV